MKRLRELYSAGVHRLTKQEQLVLCTVIALLLTGWAVKAYRTATAEPALVHTLRH